MDDIILKLSLRIYNFNHRIFLVNCEWGEWKVGGCTKTCGGGTQKKTRVKTFPEKNGGTCTGQSTETQSCNTQRCPGSIYDYVIHLSTDYV